MGKAPVSRRVLYGGPAPPDLAAVGAELAGVPVGDFEAWLAPRLERALASSLEGFAF